MSSVNDLLKGVQENIPLAPYTTFKIGGEARYFYIAKTADEIKQAVKVAKESKLPYYIIGNGSNILVSDGGFGGLIIKIKNQEIKITGNEISAGAGVMLANLVGEAAKEGLTGLEWMAGIPGTIGGAIYGNAGAFGGSLGEKIETVEVFDPDGLATKLMNRKECEFAYRGSIFRKNKYIILGAVFKLEKGDPAIISGLIKDNIKKRSHLPKGYPSAGSVFKNPLIAENQKAYENMLKKFPEAEKFKATGKIPAGWLTEEYGLLGKKIGGAMIAKDHGNFILNAGGAKAEDVIMLTGLIKEKIRVKFGIQLEEEIQYVGF